MRRHIRGLSRMMVLSLWALAWGVPCGTWAAENPPPTLSLAEAVATALQHNPQVKAARFQVDAASAQVTQARSGLLPQLDVSESFSRTNSPLWAFGTRLNQGTITEPDFFPDRLNDPDPINNFNTALTLTWRLFDGQSWIGWRQARRNVAAGRLALQRNEQTIVAQTARAYLGCLLSVENLNVIAQSLETAGAHLKVVEDRQRSGMAVRSDLLRAQVRIADLEQQRLQADSHVKVSLARLGAAMGKPDAVPPAVRLENVLQGGAALEGDLDTWLQKTLAHRPDLEQLQIQEEVAQRQVSRARSGHYPTVALQGSYEINSEQYDGSNDNYTIGAAVQLNLYSGQRISAQTAEARALLSRIKSMREGLALSARVETQQAFYEAQSAWESIRVARTAVDQAEEALRIIGNRYQNGLLTVVDLMDAQVALQQAQTHFSRALHDYKVAGVGLALASGVLDGNAIVP